MQTDPHALPSPMTIDPNQPGRVHSPGPTSADEASLAHRSPGRRSPTESGDATGGDSLLFPARLFDRPNSVFIYGPSRPLVNLTVFALAEAITPHFQWLEIGVPGEERTVFDPIRLGWIPEGQLWTVEHPDALRPDDLTANLALFSLIRSDEPPSALAHLSDFLRLPETSQRILATRPQDGKPGALAVTNAHRVLAAYPTSRVPAILSVHRDAGFSVIVGYSEAVGPGRGLFDFVFRLDCEHIGDWKKGHLVCEKGITAGPFRDSRPVPLGSIPLLADVVARAVSPA